MAIPILGYIYLASAFIPVSVGLARYRSIAKPMKILTLLCILSLINAGTELVLARYGLNNQFLANAYVPVEVFLITLVYYLSLSVSKYRRILVGCASVFLLVWTADRIFLDMPDQMNSEMAIVSRLFLFAMSLVVISALSRDATSRLDQKYLFWIATGVIVYSTGTFIVAGLGNRLLQLSASLFVIAWHINWLLLIIANLLYTKGLLCRIQA
jgi:hypothetical protein